MSSIAIFVFLEGQTESHTDIAKIKQQDRGEDVELSRAMSWSWTEVCSYHLDPTPISALKDCLSSSLPANVDIYRVHLQSSGWTESLSYPCSNL